jgi:hypothetical protein
MKKANLAVEILVIMVLVVLTVAFSLYLVKTGIIEVDSGPKESMLNLEFIPISKINLLSIENFQFCDYILGGKCYANNQFYLPSEVYFVFSVKTDVHNGKIKLIENYRIKNSQGEVILEVDAADNFHFDLSSGAASENVFFTDFFSLSEDLEPGTYTLDLVIQDAISSKKVTSSKNFEILPEYIVYEEDESSFEGDYEIETYEELEDEK